VAKTATAVLNDDVFAAPGLDPAETRTLIDLLRRIRADAGDL
jgi:hypothetical protein